MLSNYTELQAEIADTLHRDDLTAKIPSFIKLFEATANRALRTLLQEMVTNLTLAAGTNSIALPANLIEVITVNVLLSGQPQEIVQQTAGEFDNGIIATTFPQYYNVNAGNLVLDAIADQPYTIVLRYLKRWDIAADTTNWLLTNHPDLYLYGSLAASSLYTVDDARLPTWAGLAENAINAINANEERTRARTVLTVDPAILVDSAGFNINRGY